MNPDRYWQEDWEYTRQRYAAWWRGDGMVLHVLAPRDRSTGARQEAQAPFYYVLAGLDIHAHYRHPAHIRDGWLDPALRVRNLERDLPHIFFGGDAFPFFDTHTGPGGLATFLGAVPDFAEETVWYHPGMADLAGHPPLRFDPENVWYVRQKALLEAGMRAGEGRFLVGMPDLIENLDILAALRGSETLMIDLIEQPDQVRARLDEINRAYFDVFDRFFEIVRDPWGGNAFSAFYIWGPGKTAKVQCDAAAMISPRMFDQFVAPALAAQCAWLDYAMYHLDGTQAIPVLESLLRMAPLKAIEWTPQASLPQGGDPMWYDLYRRILAAGKSVQVVSVRPAEVLPLLDAVGTRGMFLTVNAESEAQARALLEAVAPYRGAG